MVAEQRCTSTLHAAQAPSTRRVSGFAKLRKRLCRSSLERAAVVLTCERAAGELDEETNEFLTCSAELVSSLAGQYLECYQAFSAAGGAEEAEEALRLVYEHVELVWRFLVCVLTHTVASRSALSSSPVVERRRHTCPAAGAGPRRPKHTSARAHSIYLTSRANTRLGGLRQARRACACLHDVCTAGRGGRRCLQQVLRVRQGVREPVPRVERGRGLRGAGGWCCHRCHLPALECTF